MVTGLVDLTGTGTPEQVWRAWPGLSELPVVSPPPRNRLVVVAPHPDDEVLGVGGLMAIRPPQLLIGVTGGEGSHPGSTVTGEQLRARRRRERAAGLDQLDATGTQVLELSHPDGAVEEELLTEQLAGLLTATDLCLATWRHDGHPDHDTVGRAAARACASLGAVLWEYPVWTWHWAGPADPRIPWHRLHRIELDPAVRAAKAAALAQFTSQTTALGPDHADRAVLPPHVLERFDRPAEFVLLPAAGGSA